ncbi:hypothetical protein C477_15335 [Haloterrigena salina JCM 13891]|uniref:DUF7350 domain-containing protein n=1 Tax=Haloterrigena salina JCM 13891 TaxID=1227488 RepID=M0C262_9EURY|nr:hypothetical protein [Haloterrigena salina]ELZ16417.1 hypothetical protein C477_15335 [Haloterrigena salina JCM 13891]
MDHEIDRRTFVGWGAATGALALAGCFGEGGDENGGERNDSDGEGNETDENRDETVDVAPPFPEIEDKPDAVYVPTHRESMRALEPIVAGDYRLAPMLSYPHPFWLVTGDGEDDVQHVTPDQMRGVHMMFTLWDAETGVVLPVDSGNVVRLSRDGERVGSPQSMWPMLSQEMGFHFGDNVPLEEDGTYTVEVELPPLSARTTGDLAGRFAERETATFEFDYDQDFRETVSDVDYFDEGRWGERGALEPMAHDHVPYSRLPEVDAFPGTFLVGTDESGEIREGRPESTAELPRSGDAAFLATVLESDYRLTGGDGRSLLVSPRTPYNRVPLPNMSLDATIERDGESVTAEPVSLEQTIDGEYGLHYGASLEDVDLRAGDTVTLTIRSLPQVARHQGYDTAFLEMPPIELRVPEDSDDAE